jgi:hypothetical protein
MSSSEDETNDNEEQQEEELSNHEESADGNNGEVCLAQRYFCYLLFILFLSSTCAHYLMNW